MWKEERGAPAGPFEDLDSGEIRPIAVVSDNGPCFKAAGFAAFIAKRPELIHIRTRQKSPQQNGVRGRAFGSLKYEHLYRLEIDDGHQLGIEGRAVQADLQRDQTTPSTRPATASRRPPRSLPA